MSYNNISLSNLLKKLAIFVFKHLESDRIINHQTTEETITDLLVRKMKQWKFNNPSSKFDINSFSKRQEALNGADFEWDWYFVDKSRKKWLGFRIQAKVLDLKSNRFKHIDHKQGNQLKNLENVSLNENRIPFYCFYLTYPKHKDIYGCSLSSSDKIKSLLKTNKKPFIKDVLQISFPWHELFNKKKGKGLIDSILFNLKKRNIDFKLLTKDEISRITDLVKKGLDDQDIKANIITIIQEKD
ncbi:DUF6615 family protein [Rodentibacter trehalosifermentans]|nr:DUF6615 family protein [Rodentibacter trehalosifermentans]